MWGRLKVGIWGMWDVGCERIGGLGFKMGERGVWIALYWWVEKRKIVDRRRRLGVFLLYEYESYTHSFTILSRNMIQAWVLEFAKHVCSIVNRSIAWRFD